MEPRRTAALNSRLTELEEWKNDQENRRLYASIFETSKRIDESMRASRERLNTFLLAYAFIAVFFIGFLLGHH